MFTQESCECTRKLERVVTLTSVLVRDSHVTTARMSTVYDDLREQLRTQDASDKSAG